MTDLFVRACPKPLNASTQLMAAALIELNDELDHTDFQPYPATSGECDLPRSAR